MHGVLAPALVPSSKAADQTDSGGGFTGQTVSDDNDEWFVGIARALLPKDAGLALHVATGFEERTCYRYAAGDRKPPGYFIRALLRSDDGWQWLAALMDGSNAEWWRDLVRARRIAEAISNID